MVHWFKNLNTVSCHVSKLTNRIHLTYLYHPPKIWWGVDKLCKCLKNSISDQVHIRFMCFSLIGQVAHSVSPGLLASLSLRSWSLLPGWWMGRRHVVLVLSVTLQNRIAVEMLPTIEHWSLPVRSTLRSDYLAHKQTCLYRKSFSCDVMTYSHLTSLITIL